MSCRHSLKTPCTTFPHKSVVSDLKIPNTLDPPSANPQKNVINVRVKITIPEYKHPASRFVDLGVVWQAADLVVGEARVSVGPKFGGNRIKFGFKF